MPYQQLIDYAFNILARKSYTHYELGEKLRSRAIKMQISPEARDELIEKVLVRLQELGYVNDGKILENYLEYRVRSRPMGRFLFVQKMHRRGIPFETARRAWDGHGLNELEMAKELARERLSKFDGAPKVLKQKKIISLLSSRGFSPDIVYQLLDEVS